MTLEKRQSYLSAAIIVLAVALDQLFKLYIRTHYALGEVHEITSWFMLCFVENDGMAFGIEWFDKIFLTIFRILAVGVLAYYIHRLIYHTPDKAPVRTSFLVMVSLIAAGALGNIVDCIFYGKLFGYAPWFYGRVVDMLYFPLITNQAGECLFFRPVFNLADSCITVAVICIIIWFRRDLDESLSKSPKS